MNVKERMPRRRMSNIDNKQTKIQPSKIFLNTFLFKKVRYSTNNESSSPDSVQPTNKISSSFTINQKLSKSPNKNQLTKRVKKAVTEQSEEFKDDEMRKSSIVIDKILKWNIVKNKPRRRKLSELNQIPFLSESLIKRKKLFQLKNSQKRLSQKKSDKSKQKSLSNVQIKNFKKSLPNEFLIQSKVCYQLTWKNILDEKKQKRKQHQRSFSKNISKKTKIKQKIKIQTKEQKNDYCPWSGRSEEGFFND